MTRAFISIDIPEKIRKDILKIQKQLPEFYGKLTEPENLHLTLKFLGEVDEEKIEKVKLNLIEIKYGRFETEVEYLGFFDNIKRGKKYGPIWLHLTNCEGLQKKIDESLGDIFPSEKRFMSHLTIARVKSLDDKKYFLEGLGKIKIPKIKFGVDNFMLKKSILKPEGPVYETIEEYKLI